MNHIVLIGHGKMGLALAKGWVKETSKYKISIIEKEEQLLNYEEFTNVKAYKNFNEFFTENKKIDFVVLAIKPQQLNDIKNDILKFENKSTVFISILAGKSVSWFKENISTEIKIVRAMPNLPASISRGVTAIYCSSSILPNEKLIIEELLSSIGTVSFVSNEEQIDLITAISGSGPAYFFYLTEALTEIAIDLGISKNDAINFSKNTFIIQGDPTPLEVKVGSGKQIYELFNFRMFVENNPEKDWFREPYEEIDVLSIAMPTVE